MSYLEELEAVVEELRKGRSVAVAVVVKKLGSAPRDVGARMVVKEDRGIVGTLGGGVFERLVYNDALEALKEGKPRTRKYVFRREQVKEGVETGQICGGEVEVFIDVLKPVPRIVLVGAGHLAQAISKVASAAGFRIAVTDVNPELASKDRFPMAEEVVSGDFEEGLRRLNPSNKDLIVIVYGGVEEDYRALLAALETPAKYIGVLGSRRKCMEFLKRLRERGYRDEELKGRVHMPVGIDIGADTPEEIAVATVAEIISFLKGGTLKSLTIV